MTLTLWRGDELLGELIARVRPAHERPQLRHKPPLLSAYLVPAPDSVALDGVWQIVLPPEVGVGVQQRAVEPDIVAERAQRAATQVTTSGPVALEPMSPEAVAGVPQEVQLTVRAADGTVYLPRQIRLQESRYEPALYEAVLQEVPLRAFSNGSIWSAFIAFASDAEAPAT